MQQAAIPYAKSGLGSEVSTIAKRAEARVKRDVARSSFRRFELRPLFYSKDGSMTLRRDILTKTEQVIEILKALPADEVAVGWDESCVKTWLPFFKKIRDALLAPAPLPKEYNSLIIVRELDFSGLTAGRIYDLSIEITEGLSEIVARGE